MAELSQPAPIRSIPPFRHSAILSTFLLLLFASAAHPQDSAWPSYGRDFTNQRYSPLTQLTPSNAGRLVLRRAFQTGTPRLNGLIGSPLIVDGTMYVTTPYNTLIAWDLRTGRTLWRYEHKPGSTIFCCGPTNRGAAVGHGLVYMGTLDAKLVAVDHRTGEVRWEVQDSDPDSAYSITLAPLVVDSLVVIGTGGGEFPIRGRVTAYHALTGKLIWRWYVIPSPAEGGWWGTWATTHTGGESLGRDIAKEKADSAKYPDSWQIGGGGVWTTPAYDPELGLLYIGTGNPAPSYDASMRPGDNLYTGSLVALEVSSGKVRWYRQYFPHDVWDYDAANPPVLFTENGRKLVAHAGKPGWVYILDARSGEFVRRTDRFVPGENLFAIPSPSGVRYAPSANGGADWHPSAWSPKTGMLYVPAVHLPQWVRMFPQQPQAGKDYRGGNEDSIFTKEAYGVLTAVETGSGRVAWQQKMGESHPGGALATAGGLVFVGDHDGVFHAFDGRTGREVWAFRCGASVNAPPVAYSLDGEEFVAVAAGGNSFYGGFGDTIFIFGLRRDFGR